MRYYNEINKGYNALHAEEQAAKATLIKESCRLQGLLLDVGAGTGSATALFRESADCAIALDPAKEMLSQYPGLKVVARAEQLPFKASSFDSIISLTALHHTDLPSAMAEIERVAKQGASIGISFFKRAANFAEAKRLFKGFRLLNSEKDLLFARP